MAVKGQSVSPGRVIHRRRTHEGPVPDSEELGERVKGQVAPGALGVVVGRGELCPGGREGAAAKGVDGRRGADC